MITVEDVPDTPPAAPLNLLATVNSDGSVALTWDDSGDDSITGYQILRRRPTQDEQTLLVYMEDTGSATTAYTDSATPPGVPHVYGVKAINSSGLSGVSNFVRAKP